MGMEFERAKNPVERYILVAIFTRYQSSGAHPSGEQGVSVYFRPSGNSLVQQFNVKTCSKPIAR
jgi:hypothetical protein